jgi:uncharacterized protein (DUF2336 family)
MSAALSIIGEVESALHGASAEKRSDVLRRVTDLFVSTTDQCTESQTALFGGVMGQLITHVESRAMAELSLRLAPISNAPTDIVKRLAFNDDIEVSGPVLATSVRLTDADMVEIARTMSQAHLAKLASRKELSEAVTDVLVDHGDSKVANQLAVNLGAKFSRTGMAKLVMRADGDDTLTQSIAVRGDIPPRLFQQLLAQATEVVRKKLLAAAPPEKQAAIQQVLAGISAQVAPKRAAISPMASHALAPLSQDTERLQTKILEFANEKRIPETLVGLAMLSQVPVEDVERLFYSPTGLGIVMLCRALGLDWLSADMIIMATPFAASADQAMLADVREQYAALSVNSAQRLLRFWQGRQAVLKAMVKKAGAAGVD